MWLDTVFNCLVYEWVTLMENSIIQLLSSILYISPYIKVSTYYPQWSICMIFSSSYLRACNYFLTAYSRDGKAGDFCICPVWSDQLIFWKKTLKIHTHVCVCLCVRLVHHPKQNWLQTSETWVVFSDIKNTISIFYKTSQWVYPSFWHCCHLQIWYSESPQ